MQVFCCLEKFFITNNVRRELSYTHHLNLDPNNIREVEKLQYRYHNTFHKVACARVTQLSNLGHDIFKNVFAVVSQVAAEGTLHVFLPIPITVERLLLDKLQITLLPKAKELLLSFLVIFATFCTTRIDDYIASPVELLSCIFCVSFALL